MRGTNSWVAYGVGVALLVSAACSSDEKGGGLAALGVDDGASKGVAKSAQVTGDEDVRIALSTGALLDVPKGAVEKSTMITMERPADSKAVELVERFKQDQDRIVSAPYVLTPHGTKFKEDVTVTLPLSKMPSREVSVAWLEDERDTQWKVLGVAKTDGKKAEIVVKHFSVLVVVEDTSDLPMLEEEPPADADAGSSQRDAGDVAEEIDAGSEVEPDRDASTSQPVDTGTTSLDAGRGEDLDAGSSRVDAAPALDAALPVADAGTSAPDGEVPIDPGPPDTGVIVAPDAGTGQSDAGTTTSDASVPPDAGPGADELAQTMYLKLQSCDHVVQPGPFHHDVAPDGIMACVYACHAQGTCDEALSTRCSSYPINDGGGFSQATADCIDACFSFVCPEQTVASRCNEVPECTNGEDEQFCEGSFYCSTQRISYYQRCDGIADCTDQSDEAGCFGCDGSRVIPPDQFCDGTYHCDDGADEPAACAQVACPIPG